MKKVFCMIALAAITFSSVYAAPAGVPAMQQDSVKKKEKVKKDTKKPPMK